MFQTENATVYYGNNLDVLPTLPDNSVDAIVTDPPYELGFMGKSWDSSGIAYSVELWQECLRVLKPGGHLLAFGGSRTWHRLAVAIEDAGFELRDSIAWLYGSGFPKSLDISKAIDKLAGAERKVVIETIVDLFGEHTREVSTTRMNEASGLVSVGQGERTEYERKETLPATDEAKKWQGWGTALKPAFEPIVVARKPLVGTVAANVLEWGVGGLNIDATRIGTTDTLARPINHANNEVFGEYKQFGNPNEPAQGRFPANIILDEHTAGLLDEQSGLGKDGVAVNRNRSGQKPNEVFGKFGNLAEDVGFGGSGGASRFFYVAKANKKDRNEGLENLPEIANSDWPPGFHGDDKRGAAPRQNFHPTVKPTALMEYLVKLITPLGGTVLDPFTGSGSTGKAALLNGYKFIGIELTDDYHPIIEGRLTHAEQTRTTQTNETLF